MATSHPTSVMDPGDSAEWKACREAIGRFDQILSSLRQYGFTLITTLMGGSAFLATIKDTPLPAHQKAGLVLVLGGLITALSFIDRYYVVLQSGAAQRAVAIEYSIFSMVALKWAKAYTVGDLQRKAELESLFYPGNERLPARFLTGILNKYATTSQTALIVPLLYLMLLGLAVSLGFTSILPPFINVLGRVWTLAKHGPKVVLLWWMLPPIVIIGVVFGYLGLSRKRDWNKQVRVWTQGLFLGTFGAEFFLAWVIVLWWWRKPLTGINLINIISIDVYVLTFLYRFFIDTCDWDKQVGTWIGVVFVGAFLFELFLAGLEGGRNLHPSRIMLSASLVYAEIILAYWTYTEWWFKTLQAKAQAYYTGTEDGYHRARLLQTVAKQLEQPVRAVWSSSVYNREVETYFNDTLEKEPLTTDRIIDVTMIPIEDITKHAGRYHKRLTCNSPPYNIYLGRKMACEMVIVGHLAGAIFIPVDLVEGPKPLAKSYLSAQYEAPEHVKILNELFEKFRKDSDRFPREKYAQSLSLQKDGEARICNELKRYLTEVKTSTQKERPVPWPVNATWLGWPIRGSRSN